MNGIPGVRVFLTNPPAIRIGGVQGRSAYQYTLQGASTAELYEAAPKLEAELHTIPQLVDITSDLQLANPQVSVTLDRDRIAALGLTVDQVESAMTGAYSSSQVGQIYAPTNQYQIIMRVVARIPGPARRAVAALRAIAVQRQADPAQHARELHAGRGSAERSAIPANCRP